MLTSYFGRYQTLYMLPSQVQTMGRTHGPDLVIPNVQRLYSPQQHQLQQPDLYCCNQVLLQQQQPELKQNQHHRQQQQQLLKTENVCTTDTSHATNCSIFQTKSEDTNGKTEPVELGQCASPKIKFSIERILSNDSVTCKSTTTETVETTNKANALDADLNSTPDDLLHYDWLHCTRYKPPKLQRSRRKESCKKRKLGRNPRVPFTQHQVAGLEQKFGCTHYLSSMDVAELSSDLNLTETRVKIWFQNRRARERRNNQTKQPTQEVDHVEDQPDSKFLFVPSSSGFGSSLQLTNQKSPQGSLIKLQEALQHCSAFTPLIYRHATCGTLNNTV